MTAREWTIVALRTLLAVIFAAIAVVAVSHGGGSWFEVVVACSMAAAYFGIVAFERWSDARWRDAYRRGLR